MKYVIDTDVLKELDIGIDEAMYIVSLYLNKNITSETFDKLNSKGLTFIKSFDEKGLYPLDVDLSINGIQKAELIFAHSEIQEKTSDDKDRFNELAAALRELYPTGKKSGTNYQWRDSVSIISARLKTLVRKYNCTFTNEQAIAATKAYIQSFNGDYRYMQLLKYFICKNVAVDGVVENNSQLLSWIENLGQEDSQNQDWTATLK